MGVNCGKNSNIWNKMNGLSYCVSGEENLLAILKRRWWKYMILGVIDIEANYLVIKAYQYTTLTSVQVRVHPYTVYKTCSFCLFVCLLAHH